MLEILACAQPCLDRSFEKLSELLFKHAGETSGLILVLLDWDKKRKDLIRQLRIAGISLIVFIINNSLTPDSLDTVPLSDTPQRIILLQENNIEEMLQKLDWSKL